ncbi:hypothetical protein K3495_g11692 [Podosphaera aphanis]|nr:hypothetical protein K3495_g11692 [Podosphaera aphanis]
MADNSLKDRLIEHAKSFDGLLSLIPAKFYYGEDNSDQWKKKKQTKKQAAAARRAKLDPDSAKTAKDVMDERARKRKLEEAEEVENSEIEGVQKELPKEGLKHADQKKKKKQKITNLTDKPQSKDSGPTDKEEKKRLKQEKRKEMNKNQPKQVKHDSVVPPKSVKKHTSAIHEDIITDEDVSEKIDFEPDGLEEKRLHDEISAPSTSGISSPTFDSAIEPSSNTSTSSIIPPAKAPKNIKIPVDPELLRSRLAARIEALRAARKADGPDGRPARNRQELLEARRKKEDQRRAHKKELRLKAKAEEDARREAAIASARNSPVSGFLNPAIRSPDQNLSFGRVSFADGQQLTNDLGRLKNVPKKRGPQDPGTALLATEKKLQRIAGLDEEKRADIEEKDRWLKANKRAHGEKVLDDTSLLKKTLKRKEKTKKKSEKEWTERKEGVAKSQAMKQKKREENLRKRREEKGTKGKSKGKVAKTKKPRVKSRPGFEGSFGSGRRK